MADAITTPAAIDPENPARSWQKLRCAQPGCEWGWDGYLPTESSASSAAAKRIVDEHYRHEHPDVPRGD